MLIWRLGKNNLILGCTAVEKRLLKEELPRQTPNNSIQNSKHKTGTGNQLLDGLVLFA